MYIILLVPERLSRPGRVNAATRTTLLRWSQLCLALLHLWTTCHRDEIDAVAVALLVWEIVAEMGAIL